jgi:succinylarginine dihydrolase
VHFTPANLIANLHRSIEATQTKVILRKIFSDAAFFAHHDPLPGAIEMADEGAANHTRLSRAHGATGLQVFTYGRAALDTKRPRRFAGRQTLEASTAVARAHHLHPERTLFVRQNPKAIDAGVFHNDVVAVGNLDVLFYHEAAMERADARRIAKQFKKVASHKLNLIEVKERTMSLKEAVDSYLFNSQLVSLPSGGMALVVPSECQEKPKIQRYLDRLLRRGTPIREVHFVDVRQSMQNGGGPACLRLRVVLTEPQMMRMHAGVMLTNALYDRLSQWVSRHYRVDLAPQELADPKLLVESRDGLDELTRILQLGNIYGFQQ